MSNRRKMIQNNKKSPSKALKGIMNNVTAPPKIVTKVAAAPSAKLNDLEEFSKNNSKDVIEEKTHVLSPLPLDQ